MSLLNSREEELMLQAQQEGRVRRRSWYLNSFLMAKLCEEGAICFKNVARWSSKAGVNVFECDKVGVSSLEGGTGRRGSFITNRMGLSTAQQPLERVMLMSLPLNIICNNVQILVPVHIGRHWTLAIIDVPGQRIQYLNSYAQKDEYQHDHLQALMR